MAGLIYRELWHDSKTRRWSSDMGWLWILLISYCEDHDSLTGFISTEDAIIVAAMNTIPQTVLDDLVVGRGIDHTEGGYNIHNYRKRRRLTLTMSQKRSEAGRLGGVAKAEAQLANGLANDLANGLANGLANESSELAKELAQRWGVSIEECLKEIYETWIVGLGGAQREFGADRQKVIIARLREGYSPADLKDAVRGWANDPWPERRLHNDITILLRNGQQVEKFRDLWRVPPQVPQASSPFKTGGAVERKQTRMSAWDKLANDYDEGGVDGRSRGVPDSEVSRGQLAEPGA